MSRAAIFVQPRAGYLSTGNMSRAAIFVLSLLVAAVCASGPDVADPGADGARSPDFLVYQCVLRNTTSNAPPHPEEYIDTSLHLYTRDNAQKGSAVKLRDSAEKELTGSRFSGQRVSIFVTHGLWGSGADPWMIELKDALLAKLDANVFVVDWKKGAQWFNPFDKAASNTFVVGRLLAKFASQLVSSFGQQPTAMYGIGFGLGAHVMGFFGKNLPGLGRITGLDPAAPCFEGQNPDKRLAASDAVHVDIVHTTFRRPIWLGGSLTLGLKYPAGHVDFYLNSTEHSSGEQPGCGFLMKHEEPVDQKFLLDIGFCSHIYAYKVFTESFLLQGSAWACHEGSSPPNKEECVRFGYNAFNTSTSGSFYLQSHSEKPYLVAEPDAE